MKPALDKKNSVSRRRKWLGVTVFVFFLICLISGSGFLPSIFGGILYGGGIFWFFSEKIKNDALATQKRQARRHKKQHLAQQRQQHRDSDRQESSYTYVIGRHANETLALRYGLANTNYTTENKTIRIRKIKLIKEDFYEVELSDFGDRKAVAVIEKGTEYVKTFYPLSETWFAENNQLESLLKNNRGLSISDIAKYHIDTMLRH